VPIGNLERWSPAKTRIWFGGKQKATAMKSELPPLRKKKHHTILTPSSYHFVSISRIASARNRPSLHDAEPLESIDQSHPTAATITLSDSHQQNPISTIKWPQAQAQSGAPSAPLLVRKMKRPSPR
jgi:hypothetical protein